MIFWGQNLLLFRFLKDVFKALIWTRRRPAFADYLSQRNVGHQQQSLNCLSEGTQERGSSRRDFGGART